MTIQSKANLATLILLLALGISASADDARLADVRIIPEDLYQYGLKHGCLQITNYYREHERSNSPPYAYGLMTRKPDVEKKSNVGPIWFHDSSAVFWCVPDSGKSKTFALLFNFGGGQLGMAQCPDMIENQDYTGGLSVISDLDESLESYSDAVTKAKFKPTSPDEIAHGPAVRSEYDGVATIYYCYKGRWLEKSID